jgi:purine-nucleoside phosphorylase
MESTLKLKSWLTENKIPLPSLHVVLGSGFASSLEEIQSQDWIYKGEISFTEIPSLVDAGAPGHKGAYRFYQNKEISICFQTGRLHGYEGNSPATVVKPVLTLCDLGVKKFILTNAAGSLQLNMLPGSVMLIEDQVNFTGLNPLTGKNDEGKGPRFPDMSAIYSKKINSILKTHLENNSVTTHEGPYIGVNGPSFETPAEVRLFSSWGMGSVGMSTVFEAIALKHRGVEIGGISFLANMGAGLGEKEGKTLTGEEVLEEGKKKAPLILKAIFSAANEIIGIK